MEIFKGNTIIVIAISALLALVFVFWYYFNTRNVEVRHKEASRKSQKRLTEDVLGELEDDGILPVQARIYDDANRTIYCATIEAEDVRKIRNKHKNLGRKWLYQNRWLYALNKNTDGTYVPVNIADSMDNPPSKLYRAIYQPEVDIVFNVQPERNLLQKYGAILLFAGVCLFIMFMMVKG
jgi:hypothetical protein